ncbi:hypothetical protein J19TS2_01980 [Cohnella xylanilytica]|uniref:hypothetical protein n=1 Tax=Cohnella xylanilytica TaxID=557555 RepID=UPI001B1D5F46|nr:hypothetical protein [Cohnella xylanilytica]GIO10643.1 hypothetical protein J19TS2_01980 [Cohnella xylanilytica]
MADEAYRIVVRQAKVVNGNAVHYEVEYGSKVRPYFSGEPFFVEYDRDVGSVPEGLLVVPLLANLCPVAWVIGADVFVGKLDRAFHDSLETAKAAFASLYPRIKFRGSLTARELTEVPEAELPARPERTAAFFSGGVDSLGTFLRRRGENPYFITIWGGDIGFSQPDIWHEVKRYNEAFGRANGIESLFVKSSLRTFLNEELIAFNFGRFTHGWWPGVQHGIGMVGLCAPLAYSLGIGRLYVPSALPPKLAKAIPDGSNTLINNRLRWSGTKVQLEGEELTRQDKVALIADYVHATGQKLNVRVCWSNKSYGNCCRCEKCLRTIAALSAEGVDPRQAGFPVNEDTFRHLKEQLPKWLPGNELRVEYWDEIRNRSVANRERLREEAREFFDWLGRLDLQSYKKKRGWFHALVDLIPHPVFLFLKRTFI